MNGRQTALGALLALALTGCGLDPPLAITPRALVTATATEEPLPTATPRPPPTPSRTPAPTALYVANTGREGAVLRSAPIAGTRVTGLPEGTRVTPQGEEEVVEGRRWLRVREPSGQVGWVAGELLVATPPATPTVRR